MQSPDFLPSLSATSPITTTFNSISSTNGHASSRSHSQHSNSLSDSLIPEIRNEALRAVKAELRARVREDWSWSPSDSTRQSSRSPDDESVEWRERDADSSTGSRSSSPDPYKFDSPDAVSQIVATRKRKRRRRLHDEMQWNEGVRNYVLRRDAWTGGMTRPRTTNKNMPTNHEADGNARQNCSSVSPHLSATHSGTAEADADSDIDLLELVPVATPLLLPSNPIRRCINPAKYAFIYSKVIIQSLAPPVPVNLADVTRALVAGWKENGEWPPKGNGDGEANVDGKVNGNGNGNVNIRGAGKARRSVWKVKRALALGKGEYHDEEKG